MSAAYDPIAKEYKESKQLPFRKVVEAYTIFQLMGDLRGRSAVDLACGEGIYSRRMKALGAERVVGVDVSGEMIRLAEAQEEREKAGVQYLTLDASEYAPTRGADVVLCSYLLNYARTPEQLAGFCAAIFRSLKEGGLFVGFNDNPAHSPQNYASTRKFGFVKKTPGNRLEGDPITYVMYNADGSSFEFDNYYLSQQTYEEAFREAGFSDFRWQPPQIDPVAAKEFPAGYWNEFLERPPMIAMTARKGSDS